MVLQRFVQAIPTMIALTLLSFVLVHIVPGGPAQVMLGNNATPQLIAQINRSLGLDKPLSVQYVIWLGGLLHGNLGYAYSYHQTVFSLIGENLPRTLVLVVSAIVVSHLIAIAIGVGQAFWRGSAADHVVTALTYFLYTMPTFWFGIIVVSVFAIDLRWFPSGGFSSPYATHVTFGSYIDHMVLPASVLVAGTVAGWSRYMRTAMINQLEQDYIRTARSKGLSEFVVLFKHALRNSIIPLVTLVGLSLPALFSGALIIEMIFNYPGMGLLFWNAAQQRDYPVLMGIVTMVGFLTILGNLLADVLYIVVDPRVHYS